MRNTSISSACRQPNGQRGRCHGEVTAGVSARETAAKIWGSGPPIAVLGSGYREWYTLCRVLFFLSAFTYFKPKKSV